MSLTYLNQTFYFLNYGKVTGCLVLKNTEMTFPITFLLGSHVVSRQVVVNRSKASEMLDGELKNLISNSADTMRELSIYPTMLNKSTLHRGHPLLFRLSGVY